MTNEFQAEALFGEDDFGFDKTEANDLLDLRGRFDKLGTLSRLPLAEAFMRLDKGLGDEELMELKRTEIGKAEQTALDAQSRCGLCEESIDENDAVVERQAVWVTPGSNQVQLREELGQRAHAACVKRVKEGGSAEPGLF